MSCLASSFKKGEHFWVQHENDLVTTKNVMPYLLVRASDQSIIDRQGILMQILLVAGLKIVLFTSKHTVTNFMSVHRLGVDKRLFPPTLVPRTDLRELALWLSSGQFTGVSAKEFTTNDSGNRDSEQPPAVRGPLQK